MDAQIFIPLKELPFASIGKHSELPILYTRFYEQIELSQEDAGLLIKTVFPIIKENKLIYGIADNRADFITLSSKARKLLGDNESLRLLKAQGAVVNNVATRISTNFFVKMGKPVIPFKVFSAVDPAIYWLLKQK